MECAALVDLFHLLKIISEPMHVEAKQLLTHIIAMLTALCLMKDSGGTGRFTCRLRP